MRRGGFGFGKTGKPEKGQKTNRAIPNGGIGVGKGVGGCSRHRSV